jgi:hypothetical protein
MSWQAYVDNMKQYPGVNAGIVAGLANGQVYAQDGVNATQQELTDLRNFFANRTTSVFVGGVKYLVLRADENGLEGKKNAKCISVRKTNTLLVISLHNAPDEEASDQGMAQKVATASSSIADYLAKSNL